LLAVAADEPPTAFLSPRARAVDAVPDFGIPARDAPAFFEGAELATAGFFAGALFAAAFFGAGRAGGRFGAAARDDFARAALDDPCFAFAIVR
jgi:hypothetical protein